MGSFIIARTAHTLSEALRTLVRQLVSLVAGTPPDAVERNTRACLIRTTSATSAAHLEAKVVVVKVTVIDDLTVQPVSVLQTAEQTMAGKRVSV